MKVAFDTFGCRLNRAESLDLEARFLQLGWEKASSHSDADLIIVRGCSVTGRAEHDTIKFVEGLKKKYPAKRIFTLGCVKNRTPEAMLEKILAPQSISGDGSHFEPIPLSTARAYLKVQDGCNSICSFCIVPSFRGKSVSVDFSRVLERARLFLASGYTEIVVTGCNLSLYLSDGKRLPELLDALAKLPSKGHRIRIGSLEPGVIARDTVSVMADNANICRFLHIPVQSASNKILCDMRRPYRQHDIDNLAEIAMKNIPGISLGCDVISGFPGETESDHIATLEYLKRKGFTNVHAFPYSERPGTPAANFANKIAKEIRSQRAREISLAVSQKRRDFAKRFKGTKVDVMVEKASSTAGWTSEYLWCALNGTQNAGVPFLKNLPSRPKRRQMVKMLVKDVRGDTLYGDIV